MISYLQVSCASILHTGPVIPRFGLDLGQIWVHGVVVMVEILHSNSGDMYLKLCYPGNRG